MRVFVPITDEMLDKDLVIDELVAYQRGQLLLSQLPNTSLQSRSSVKRSPTTTPSAEAAPALSSSTYIAGEALG